MSNGERPPVPLLLTMDLELAPDHDLAAQRSILDELREVLERTGLRLTIFATATAAEAFSSELHRFQLSGHEIGCHGLTHARDEDFKRMSPNRIESCIREATARITDVLSTKPLCFRGPRMTTSAATQRCLIEFGYWADFSVCPQRIDIFTCRGGDIGWLRAPRVPYRPSTHSAFRRGNLPLWVIPCSSIGLPFISGTGYLFGEAVLRMLFRILLLEARRRGNGIVYLFHSYEFTPFLGRGSSFEQPVHHSLYIKSHHRRFSLHKQMFERMFSDQNICSIRASEYIANYLDGIAEASSG